MNNSFAWLIAALIPLSAGCLDNVALADRSDGGASDAPATDAPPMDAPAPGVCAACGGADSASCLYAPGCGSSQRVCAPNTCGDAIAIPFCGCDGQTFVTGCATPDRPFQHAGACQDGGPGTPDAPTPADGGGLAFCPAEVDHNAAQNPDLRYRRAAFAIPPDRTDRLDPGSSVEFIGTWAGTRRLATPIVLGCGAADPRAECLADTVIEVAMPDTTRKGFVVTVPAGDLSALTVGTPVTLRARASQWDGATPIRYEGELTVRRAGDDALMLAIATGVVTPDVGLSVDRVAAVCRSRPEPFCARVLHAFTLQFGGGSGSRILAPGGEAVVNEGGTFLCRNRVAYQRVASGGVECSDTTLPVTSFEIARQP
ncbi:MAG: hypothetical protein Q8S73_44550 [Deltaproteobacteria bacterium]|nr:hypothetical protein [Myxococcales bacterium]MDP3221237.1 hypothetical protein [Deltaproteobacteria bacterium]